MTVKIEFLKFHILRSQILFTSTPTPAMHIFDLFNYLLRFLEMILIIIYVYTQTLEYIYLFFLPLWYIYNICMAQYCCSFNRKAFWLFSPWKMAAWKSCLTNRTQNIIVNFSLVELKWGLLFTTGPLFLGVLLLWEKIWLTFCKNNSDEAKIF